MKTIFDNKPTNQELKELFSFDENSNTMAYGFSIVPLTVEDYVRITSSEEKLLDLAQLFELRGDQIAADKIWKQIPDIESQYRGGFDNNFTNGL
jgi:hypothetical protein